MVINRDPVAGGLIDSLARPGGNLDSTSEGSKISFKEYQAAALALKIQLQSMEVRGRNPDLVGAFKPPSKHALAP
jgi:hypothetical protein